MTTGMQNFSDQTTTVHSETRLPFPIKAASQVITDWTICALCQTKTSEKLVSSKSKTDKSRVNLPYIGGKPDKIS